MKDLFGGVPTITLNTIGILIIQTQILKMR